MNILIWTNTHAQIDTFIASNESVLLGNNVICVKLRYPFLSLLWNVCPCIIVGNLKLAGTVKTDVFNNFTKHIIQSSVNGTWSYKTDVKDYELDELPTPAYNVVFVVGE